MVENLKKLRIEKGISQQALADIIGISQQSINKYENHKIEPDISTLIMLADYFQTSVDYLIGRTDKKGNNVNKTSTDIMIEKFVKLHDNEKKSIETIVDTFYNLKNDNK